MAQIKMLGRRVMLTLACVGAAAGTLLVAQSAASAAYDVGSIAAQR